MSKDVLSGSFPDALEHIDEELRPAVKRLLLRSDTDEWEGREERDVIGALTSMIDLAKQRSDDETRVSVFTPSLREQGWTSKRTIINICTLDAPFLVDSVAAELARHGLAVYLLLHPQVSVHRDEKGALLELDAHGGTAESWIYLEVDRIPSEEGCAELEQRLYKVLHDVHAAVNDWTAMRRACLDIVTDLRTEPPVTVDPATIKPTVDFLSWLADDNFTFLGYREQLLEVVDGEDVLRPLPQTGLGILRNSTTDISHLTPEAQLTSRDPRLLTITKANSRATVHRDVYLDYIGVRMFDDEGRVIGERRFLGMFTSAAYNASVLSLPIAAEKVKAVLQSSGYTRTSHSGKDLLQVLEQYPRDELFQDTPAHLLEVATEASRLRERRRSRVFLRPDEFGRFVSALVYLPRDRYNTTVRLRIEALLREAFGADKVDHFTRVGESPLAQLHFIVRLPKGATLPDIREADLQPQLETAIRGWSEQLIDELHKEFEEDEASRLFAVYGDAFPEGYKEVVRASEAISDIRLMESLEHEDFAVRLYPQLPNEPGRRTLTVASRKRSPLTQVLPILTDLGVDVVDERPYDIDPAGGDRVSISDFGLTAPDVAEWDDSAWGAEFERAFAAAWTGDAESDRLNSLVLLGGLDWRRIVILRAIGMYLRQTGSAFSIEYIDQALIANAEIAADLVKLFELRFDPSVKGKRDAKVAAQAERIAATLEQVSSLDHDRILRSYVGVIQATWRTNFYQTTADGKPKPWVSMKLNCPLVPNLPKPHPMAEIWVYSPQVEGVHLRFGKVARGGLRWSDRREDFRTEVLGLVKAQMVKNAVIVPTGSKGGFFAKQLPSPADRGAWIEAGKAAYRTFIRGLLDITDNRDGDKIIPSAQVVRHDDDDPYLVVAADKGTASFSDIANAISEEYGFWLADAFASGGSAGYDHKRMGITARGAWESVKRHFREMGHDTQTEDFTVVGIGDMSGDVFGNGMLRSEHIKLVAAFDHRHVFVDPEPDPATTFAERKRLFELPGSSWGDFDRSLISKGGGVFPLSAKSIPVTPEMAVALGIDSSVKSLAPLELKRAVLLAPLDLLWNGAIGTYIKATDETDLEIGDRGNDAIRVNGADLRLRVVGEGGNLGVSQRGRIEAAMSGVAINTDAIDNSAGVGTSDREVNIKILLGAAERDGRLDREARNELLASMTDEVAVQVLRDNYEQNVLLGNSRANAPEMLPSHERLMEWLEGRGELDRELEFLPAKDEVARRVAEGRGLVRPEFSVLMAYAKLALKADLAQTELANDPWFTTALAEYFPTALRERFAGDLENHPLRSEIIVNTVVNSMVNRGGITFAYRAADETGGSAEQIARAYVVARETYDLRSFVVAVEETDNVVSTEVQTEFYLTFRRLLDRASRWFVQHRGDGVDIGRELDCFAESAQALAAQLGGLLRGQDREHFEVRVAEFEAEGVPNALATRGAGLLFELPLLDIIELARSTGRDQSGIAQVYYALAPQVHFTELLSGVTALPQDDRWGSMARAALRDDLYSVMIALTASVLERTDDSDDADSRIASWREQGGPTAQRALDEAIAASNAGEHAGLATISVALRRLRSLVR